MPDGYSLRLYRPGDENTWVDIEAAVSEFTGDVERARAHFREEFTPFGDEMEKRCYFLVSPDSRTIGTATAWYNDVFLGKRHGRLHYVAIHPDFQGRGLGKPLVSLVCRRLAELHTRAYLTSQTTSYIAIKIYLDMGFEPYLDSPDHREAWRLLAEKLEHPGLRDFLP